MRFKEFIEPHINEVSITGLKRKMNVLRNDPAHKRAVANVQKLIPDKLRDSLAAEYLRLRGDEISGRVFGDRGESKKTDPYKQIHNKMPSAAAEPYSP
jgi:hypothetical protein